MQSPPKLVLLLRVQPTLSNSQSFPLTFYPIIDKKGEKKASIEFRFAAGIRDLLLFVFFVSFEDFACVKLRQTILSFDWVVT